MNGLKSSVLLILTAFPACTSRAPSPSDALVEQEQSPTAIVSYDPTAINPPGVIGAADYPRAEWVGPACGYWPSDRTGADIEMIVIHTCQMPFYDCWAFLHSCHKPSSSSHYVVRSGDGHVVQLINDRHVGWHATCVNFKSIGIEHEGWVETPEEWFTDAMYCSSANLTAWLADQYGIPMDRAHIIGHDEANRLHCGGTHTDPGPGWDWDYYMMLVTNGCDPCTPGEKRCSKSGAWVEECDESGMTWTSRDHCASGCENGNCSI